MPGDGGGLATWRMCAAASTGDGGKDGLSCAVVKSTEFVEDGAGDGRGEGGKGTADAGGDGRGVKERLDTKLEGLSAVEAPDTSNDCPVAEVLEVGAGEWSGVVYVDALLRGEAGVLPSSMADKGPMFLDAELVSSRGSVCVSPADGGGVMGGGIREAIEECVMVADRTSTFFPRSGFWPRAPLTATVAVRGMFAP